MTKKLTIVLEEPDAKALEALLSSSPDSFPDLLEDLRYGLGIYKEDEPETVPCSRCRNGRVRAGEADADHPICDPCVEDLVAEEQRR